MRFGSVCSGIEAASVAWHPLGWQAAWVSEIEPFPCSLLAHKYPETPNFGDMPGPAKDRFPALAAAYAKAELQVLTEMGYNWTLTRKENDMLTLCDKLDAWIWARDHGVTGGEWDCALANLRIMAHKLDCTRWLDDYIK